MTGYLEIITAGILSTVQDEGRKGFQGSGFQASGCMDRQAYHDANVLVNNPLDAAVIEMLFMGITAVFHANTFFAITGANASARLNGREIEFYHTYEVKAGDKLEIGTALSGRFMYLAVAGGIQVPPVMGSYSTNLKCKIGGFKGRALAAGDEVGILEYTGFFPNLYRKEMPEPIIEKTVDLHFIWGPQDEYFTEKGKETFISEKYFVTDESDRMGYRIEGPEIEYKDTVDILSDGIVFGSIQVPASGKPMILMADRQTTGGYAKIGTVISADLPKLAQCMPGSEIHFIPVTLSEAEKLNGILDSKMRKFRRKSGYSKMIL